MHKALVVQGPSSQSKVVSTIGNNGELSGNHSYIKFGRRDSKQTDGNALCGGRKGDSHKGQWLEL